MPSIRLALRHSLQRDRRGAMALVMAFLAVPLVGSVGLAVDYQRVVTARQFLQGELDAVALGTAGAGREDASERWLERMRRAVRARFGSTGWPSTLVVSGSWRSESIFAAEARAAVDLTFLKALPGVPDSIDVAVAATAELELPLFVHEEPELVQLDPEAADYNRLTAYCFDRVAARAADDDGRSKHTVIADNAETEYDFTIPRCNPGEILSYQLLNVRLARTQPALWDEPLHEHYVYYTDTVLEDDVEQHDLGGWDMLETVLCDSLAACRPQSAGGILPEGENRVPEHEQERCKLGKYMYYGWEDRPPGRGWTDRDFDDIRLVIGCPVERYEGDKRVRLVG